MDKTQMLSQKVMDAVKRYAEDKGATLPDGFSVMLERPRREGQGDWATNAAMKLCKAFHMQPMALATEIAAMIDKGSDIKHIEAAAPGFLNFTLTNTWIADVIKRVLSEGVDYGRNSSGGGKRVQVEFVSANPTGPIHLGHGRGAVVGDVMSSVLEFSGWKVEREYYINDAGLQMEKLALSTRSRYFDILGHGDEAPFPEDGYPGAYIDDIAKGIADEHGDEYISKPIESVIDVFRDKTCEAVLKMIRTDLADFGVKFDVWFSEASLYKSDIVPRTIDKLKGAGYAYEADGAVWFKSTEFGDDKDRVMIRNNGVPTYFTSDVAYLQNKYERGFDFLIYVWGADHHGYIPRIRSVNKALGRADDAMQFLLIQFVSLLRNGEPVAMSKRAGTFVTLREVMDEVGSDAARFFFINRKCDSHLDFDLEVAKATSSDNPVYYVQYAHARICSILREAASRGISLPDVQSVDIDALDGPSEIKLAKEISRFPEEVLKAAQSLEPHKIALYASSIAEAFHVFYNSVKVLGDSGSDAVGARLLLVEASRIAIANALRLIGVTAPERM